jgi:hypothetical protein
VLVGFVDRREMGAGTDAALAHLAGCAACRREVEGTALAIHALRRLGPPLDAAAPSPDAWERLRARIERPREAIWRWRASIVGLAVSTGLVATLVAPVAIWAPRTTRVQEDGTALAAIRAIRQTEERAEQAVFAERRAKQADWFPVTSSPITAGDPSPEGWLGPDGMGVAVPAPEQAVPADRTK